jgi:hypothetical protein
MRTYQKAGLGLVAGLVVSITCAQAQSIGGRYQVQGKNFDGSTYSGQAEITVTTENTCRIVWNTGGQISRGICMRNDNAFSAAYQLGNKIGLIIYQVRPDGSMTGLWTIADQRGVGQEILLPMR